MEHSTQALTGLLVAFVAALVGGEIAQRLKVPAVVDQIAAGVAVGPSALGLLSLRQPLKLLSELGALLLLFTLGLETKLVDLRKVGKTALLAGVVGVALPFALGAGWAWASGFPGSKAMFVAAIIGAFLAGMVLAETPHRKDLEHDFARISAVLVPFFFVATGANVNVRLLASGPAIFSVLLVNLLAIVGKLVGCGLGARSLGTKAALTVGVGMAPRGEVGVIVAGLGQQAGVFPPTTYAIVVGMSLLTSIAAPPALKRLLADGGGAATREERAASSASGRSRASDPFPRSEPRPRRAAGWPPRSRGGHVPLREL